MADHPTPAELEDFVLSRISVERAREVVSHLVSGCAKCYSAVIPHVRWVLGLEDPPKRVLTPQEDAAYEAALDRAFNFVSKRARELHQERKREALALLEDFGPGKLPEVPLHLRGVPLFEALLERSWAFRYGNPQEMVRWAEWARVLAEKLEPSELGPSERELADLRCRAWVELGNAYRVADDLEQAEIALGLAAHLFVEGTENEALAARLFDVQASLFASLRDFDLAQLSLNLVFAFYRRLGESHLAGRALISKGIYCGYNGDSEEAIRLLDRGLELIDEERDPRLVYLVFHNQIRLLLDSNRARDARKALFRLKARGLISGGRVTELKLRWLEGQINVELGELERAEQALLEVKQGFEEAELGYKAALAGLELGAVMLRRGRIDDAIREVLQAADVFEAIKVRREAAASLLLLRKSFEQQTVNAALLNHVIGLLRSGEDAAGARIEGSAEE